MSKNKPSLFREDYYTPEEYAILNKLLYNSKNLIETMLRVHTAKENLLCIKRKVASFKGITSIYSDGTKYNALEIYDLMYNTHLDDVALSLNKSPVHTTICQWRFQINK
jgi:hypothetical protein